MHENYFNDSIYKQIVLKKNVTNNFPSIIFINKEYATEIIFEGQNYSLKQNINTVFEG